ncbi:MAG: TIR domain-containing protein [Nitrospirota bacterium]
MKINTQTISDRIIAIQHKCHNVLSLRDDQFIQDNTTVFKSNLSQISKSFSGSCIGYHARIYYRQFQTPQPGDHFSVEWGFMQRLSNPTSQNWVEYTEETVRKAARTDVAPDYDDRLKQVSKHAEQTCEESRDTLLVIVDAMLDKERTTALDRIRGEIKIDYVVSTREILDAMLPTNFTTRDSAAMTQGRQTPSHIALYAELMSSFSPFTGLEAVLKNCKSLLSYMEIHDMADKNTLKKAERIFIGHGHSLLWKDLKDLLQDRLNLSWEEFNREPIAGQSTTERLQTMLGTSCFAFLILTAEDEHADESVHARENVIHEAGLFQGHLGFKKAIVLLEEGCEEFSNIAGLGQIRFPKGNISACFEEIRRVLEREKIL